MKKVEISKAEEEHSTHWCRRCDKYHCVECISFYTVDFDVEENIGREDNPYIENWKGEEVCPWCYNQLVDLKQTKNVRNNSQAG